MSRRGATQQSSAPYNRMLVLDLVRRRGEVSRKDLLEMVALSPQTIANITQELEEIGLLVSRRARIGRGRGQPPMAFQLNPHGGDSIGISLEAHRISAALVSLTGDMLERVEILNDARNVDATLGVMSSVVEDLRDRSRQARTLWGVGVALPGPFNAPSLSFVGPTALEGWSDLSILGRIEERTGLSLFYNTDSVASALGETLFGVAQDLDNFFYLYFGVGLGGTLIVDRLAYGGSRGNATEIGHIPIVPDGHPCYCGGNGCLERYLSLHALSEAIVGDAGIELGEEQIVKLLVRKDVRLEQWCLQAAQHLRQTICTIENMLDPATIVIGGTAPTSLVRYLIELAMPLLPSVRTGVSSLDERVLLSDRQGDSSILGAAVLPISEQLSPSHDAADLKRAEA